MLYVLKFFVLLKMKRMFLKQDEKKLVKNTQTPQSHILLFQGFIFVLRQALHKSVQNVENYSWKTCCH